MINTAFFSNSVVKPLFSASTEVGMPKFVTKQEAKLFLNELKGKLNIKIKESFKSLTTSYYDVNQGYRLELGLKPGVEGVEKRILGLGLFKEKEVSSDHVYTYVPDIKVKYENKNVTKPVKVLMFIEEGFTWKKRY